MRCAANSIFDCAGVGGHLPFSKINNRRYLRGIFDEKRLDEIF